MIAAGLSAVLAFLMGIEFIAYVEMDQWPSAVGVVVGAAVGFYTALVRREADTSLHSG